MVIPAAQPRVLPALSPMGRPESDSAALDTLSIMGIQAVIRSQSLLDLLHSAKKVARAQNAVLITGESGTGKELVARAIHQYSPRAAKPWIDINCAAIPGHLLESELFGYEKGAFSGAESGKLGMFELANGGTLFLDEIGELELQLQAKLLRVLDGAPFFRLGGTRKNSVDVRIVAATNNNLKERVSAGKFREDLYHRLNQIHLRVPPLRERREDIEALAKHFLAQQDPGLALFSRRSEAPLRVFLARQRAGIAQRRHHGVDLRGGPGDSTVRPASGGLQRRGPRRRACGKLTPP